MAAPLLTVSTDNPRYFCGPTGLIVPLAGHYDNFSPQTGGDWAAVLSRMDTYGFNVARLWVRNHDFTPFPYTGSSPYDLDSPNATYLTALRNACLDLAARDAYAIIMLFQGWDLADYGWGNKFLQHPFHASNNTDSINGDWYDSDGNGFELSQYFTGSMADAIRAKQTVWIQAVIDAVNDLDNIIWEIENEGPATDENLTFQLWAQGVVQAYELTQAKQHPVGISARYSAGSGENAALVALDTDWIAVSGADLYDHTPPVNNNSKILFADTDHIWASGGGEHFTGDWVWKTALRGVHPLTITGRGGEDADTLAALGHVLTYLNQLPLHNTAPSSTIASTGYCLAATGQSYLIYQPSIGSFTATFTAGDYTAEWFKVWGGSVYSTGIPFTATGSPQTVTPPFVDDAAVLLLTQELPPVGQPRLLVR